MSSEALQLRLATRGGGAAASRGRDGGEGGESDGAPRSGSRASLAALLSIVYPYFWPDGHLARARSVATFGSLVAAKACTLASPLLLGRATDNLLADQLASTFSAIALFAVLRAGSSMFEETHRVSFLRTQEAASCDIARRTFTKLLHLGGAFHAAKRSPVVLRVMERGVASAATVIEIACVRLLPSLLEFTAMLFIFGVLFATPATSGVLAAGFLLYGGTVYALTQRRRKARAALHAADHSSAAIALEALAGIETVKSFGGEGAEVTRFMTAYASTHDAARQSQVLASASTVVQVVIARGTVAAVLITSALAVADRSMTIGAWVAVQAYVSALFLQLTRLSGWISLLAAALNDMAALSALLQRQDEEEEGGGGGGATHHPPLVLEKPEEGVSLAFRGVVFAYPAREGRAGPPPGVMPPPLARTGWWDALRRGVASVAAHARRAALFSLRYLRGGASNLPMHRLEEKEEGPSAASPATASNHEGVLSATATAVSIEGLPSAMEAPQAPAPPPVLRGVTFTVARGTTAAIVGRSGCGKTTISRLILRFYDALRAGAITIDGQDIATVSLPSLRAAVCIVPQECVLFHETLRFNVAYGRPAATPTELDEAVRVAQLSDLVAKLPKGLDTVVGERGVKLSGGERQRVALARAVLRDAPLVLLDEATSALDAGTEAALRAALSVFQARRRTVVMITHRLASVTGADVILVLAEGVIVEAGTHDALMAVEGGVYARLYAQGEAAPPTSGSSLSSEGGGGAAAGEGARDAWKRKLWN